MHDSLMTTDRFMTYMNYITIAAQSGLGVASSIVDAVSSAKNVDIRTFDNVKQANNTKNSLSINLTSSYMQIYNAVYETSPMSSTFGYLFEHIYRFTGMNIDEYLTTNGLLVTSTFADLCRIFGHPITSTNVE